jgi:hypothetical protein
MAEVKPCCRQRILAAKLGTCCDRKLGCSEEVLADGPPVVPGLLVIHALKCQGLSLSLSLLPPSVPTDEIGTELPLVPGEQVAVAGGSLYQPPFYDAVVPPPESAVLQAFLVSSLSNCAIHSGHRCALIAVLCTTSLERFELMIQKFGFACAIFFVAGSVFAHGPQLQVTADNGKIMTRSILNDVYEPLTSPKSVYVMEVLPYRGVWYARPETQLNPPDHATAPGQPTYYSGPGLAYGLGHTFAEGSSFSINFLTGLQLWNGANFGDAGSAELQYYRGGSIGGDGQLINPTASVVTSDGSASPLLTFAAIGAGYNEEAHSTARLRFLGDGTTTPAGSGPQTGTVASEPADGVYLASLVLSSSDSTLAASDPYYFVMHKGVPWSEVTAAVGSLGVPSFAVQVLGVPEPSALLLAATTAVGFAARRRYQS